MSRLLQAILLGILLLLARIALPAFHGASSALRGVLFRLREKPKGLRILLFPVEFLVYLLEGPSGPVVVKLDGHELDFDFLVARATPILDGLEFS